MYITLTIFMLYTGVVDAYCDLDCEVVFHTSYVAPSDGLFALHTHGGNTLELRCSAMVSIQKNCNES